jgi:hypothetical protein
MKTMYSCLLCIVCVFTGSSVVWAVGSEFTYQGRLMELGNPANGVYDLQFKLFDLPDPSGSQVGSTVLLEDRDVADGYFTVLIDFGVSVFSGPDRYLQVEVRPGVSTNPDDFVALLPRVRVTACPYSLQTRGIFVDENLNVGIGTKVPTAKLEVYTEANVHGVMSTTPYIPIYAHRQSTTGTWPAVHGENESTANNTSAIRGILNSPTSGLDAAGVYGYNKGTNNRGFGVYGTHDGTGAGVYGKCDNAGGKGVLGHSDNGFAGYFTGGFSYFENYVGIGTTTPAYNLHVKSSGYNNGIAVTSSDNQLLFRVRQASDTSCGILIYDDAGTSTVNISGNGESTFNGGDINVSNHRIKNYTGFPQPDYDSSWISMAPSQHLTLTHNVGGSVNNYVVDMQFYDTGLNGINNAGMGMDQYDNGQKRGVCWTNLTTSTIEIWRGDMDPYADQVRVRIWKY